MNVCGVDRVLRISGGLVLLLLTFVGPFTEVLYPWGLVAIVPLLTGLVGWCPAYTLFGFKRCSTAN